MGNVFATNRTIHERYDLKGSTFGRAASDEEKIKFKENVTYKDVDWRAREKKLHFGPSIKAALLEQLKKDCQLLEKLNVMDYSLLVGIHYCDIHEGADCSAACFEAEENVRKDKRVSTNEKAEDGKMEEKQENKEEKKKLRKEKSDQKKEKKDEKKEKKRSQKRRKKIQRKRTRSLKRKIRVRRKKKSQTISRRKKRTKSLRRAMTKMSKRKIRMMKPLPML